MKKILVVEDDELIQSSLKEALEIKGYQVIQATCVKQTWQYLDDSIDLMIMDIRLPDGNGITLCRQIREQFSMPLLFLTCQNDEDSIVEALNAGGDDYVCKPFGIKELYARIYSLLRRIPMNKDIIYTADLKIDTKQYKVFKNNQELDLGLVTYYILLCLVENHGVVITRNHLLDLVQQQTQHFVEDNTLSVHMKRLRNKLGTYQNQLYIETLRGVGYRWIQ
ncbi:response regulator transcription factor [Longibaculum muris]|uniref:response regulator transcription factor n=2 Tax=Longibaculum muris TaxID=1796628 RepID=UPI0012B89472|nr:response regulator transcription factor [Longibaculum muris]